MLILSIEKSTLRAELNKSQGSFNSYPCGTLIFSLPLFPYTQLAINCAMTIGDYFLNLLENGNTLT
jgi:hypothetical protein